MSLYCIIAVLVLCIDLITKEIILNTLPLGASIEIFPFFNLVHVLNKGVSFSMFSNTGPAILTAIAVLICCGIVCYIFKEKNTFLRICLSMILGGALGNIFDRIRFGAVVDFLDFHAFGFHWPAFNIADSAICIGVILYLSHITFTKKEIVK